MEMQSQSVSNSVLNNLVTIDNVAARSAHGFTLNEKRVVMGALSKMDGRIPEFVIKAKQGGRMPVITITAREYAELAKLDDLKNAYKQLKQASDKLFDRYIRVVVEGKRGKEIEKYHWLSKVKYYEGEGKIEIVFDSEVMPFITGLNRLYTQYRLIQTEGLRSIYSWRILELINSSKTKKKQVAGTFTLTLDELRHALEIPPKYVWQDIKRWVLEQAKKELNSKDHYTISYKGIKKGRSFHKVEISWEENAQGDLFK